MHMTGSRGLNSAKRVKALSYQLRMDFRFKAAKHIPQVLNPCLLVVLESGRMIR